MARHIVLGNGNIIVGLDKFGLIRNYCYPYVGKEDHVKGHHHRMGIWVNGSTRWIHDGQGWEGSPRYKKDALVGDSTFVNPEIGIQVNMVDCVHVEKNIFLKKITVRNLNNEKRDIKVFLNQHFHIAGDNMGDTSLYEPFTKSIISYKSRRFFLINGTCNGNGFSQYATGSADEGSRVGTWVDGNDGTLSQNPIEHGSVDSTISFDFTINPEGSQELFYWICTASSMEHVRELHEFTLNKGPQELIDETQNYWVKWVNQNKIDDCGLDSAIIDLFKRSLLVVRAHTDNNGAIMAAIDSDILGVKQDTYNYVWPRDGALISRALDKAGYPKITDEFFEFCSDLLSEEGYLFHRYLPDKSIGSSWHPWIMNGKIQLPMQEDETALVLDALWKKYKKYPNRGVVKKFYDPFIKKTADFLVRYRDNKTNLPLPSWDLWEEKLGIHTFTCATVYAGLIAATNFAKTFEQHEDATKYETAAKEVKEAILTHLYDEENKLFIKRLYEENGELKKDTTIDSSTAYGLFEYKVLDVNDIRMEETMNKTIAALHNKNATGGYIRYQNDNYFREKNSPSNPWVIATLWVAEYYITKARSITELKPAADIFNWVVKHSFESGVLPEQYHPITSEPRSVAPLTWSHAGFIIAIVKYTSKYKQLKDEHAIAQNKIKV